MSWWSRPRWWSTSVARSLHRLPLRMVAVHRCPSSSRRACRRAGQSGGSELRRSLVSQPMAHLASGVVASVATGLC